MQPGKVLLTLSPRGRTQLVIEIDEKNLGLLATGQEALASADAYPQQRFPATLVYINSGVNALTGAVQVKLDVPSPPAVLKQDMTVSVDIEGRPATAGAADTARPRARCRRNVTLGMARRTPSRRASTSADRPA